jgi:hypothetical protein
VRGRSCADSRQNFSISRSLGVGLGRFHDESLMDVGDHTTTGDGGLDEGVELLVTTDSELQVAGSDALNLKVLAGVTCQFEHLSREVLKDGSRVDSGGSTDTGASVDSCL